MKTFWQMLGIAFWMLPLQRVLTVAGVVVIAVGLLVPGLEWRTSGRALLATLQGATLLFVVPLLAGGMLLRMVSASRALLLRPHARGRLLVGTAAILVLVALVWITCYAMIFVTGPLVFRPDFEVLLSQFALTLAFGTQCLIALFIASRSPLWALLVLLAWQVPGLLLHVLDPDSAARLLGGPVSLGVSAAAWTGFSVWFLKARRIHAASWRVRAAPADPSPAGDAAGAAASAVAMSRETAMSRWVLANATPLQMALQCLAAALLVVGIQWVYGRETGPAVLNAMTFGMLAATGLVAGALASGMAARSRALWLVAGRTRRALHAWLEMQMLRVLLAVLAAVVLAGLAVWWVLPRPAISPAYLLPALLAPGLAAAWLGLMQSHRRGLFDLLAGVAIVAGIFYGLVQPLYEGRAEGPWAVLGAQLGLGVLLREVALVRWRGADWRRAQRA